MTNNMVEQSQSTQSCRSRPLINTHLIVPTGRKSFVKLDYKIHEFSGHSSNYTAEHILEDHPNDQSSRWSSLTNDQNQFVMLKLERPSLVRTITFGKFFKTHVCNLKEFRVMAGSSVNNLFEVVHSGLRNDSEMETFPFKFKDDIMQYSPIQYVKIVPMAAWGNNFNFSIWYVELRGISDLAIVKVAHNIFHERKRFEAWRLCLKFLRGEPSMAKLVPAIEAEAGFTSESPLVESLYQLAVERGDFSGAEALIKDAAQQQDLFGEYVKKNVPYECVWERLDQAANFDDLVPGKRGGHQMCWDPVGRKIYMFGGWDGTQDLSDFWMYDVGSSSWTCLSQDTRLENGPGPRSCHKICVHAERRALYVFGRFVEQDSRTGMGNVSLAAEFYQYDLEAHVWTLLSADTHSEGGPSLLYDHQMVVDEDRGLIYVFGGRLINFGAAGDNEAQYSGLYVYEIDGRKWRCLRPDATDKQPERSPVLRSRIGHSMVFDPRRNQLIILAGQRNKDYLADYYVYDIESDTVLEMEKDTSRCGGPDAGFTQRSTIDLDLGELYLFTGLMRDTKLEGSASSNNLSKNTFWVYSLQDGHWCKLEEREKESEWPCPRFAHQLVYDPAGKAHYLFGGNPGESGSPKRRLSDFWRLKLVRRTGAGDILRRACFLLRRQHYYELCLARKGMEALKFLQNEVAAVVRHDDQAESEEFRSLSAWLFQQQQQKVEGVSTPVFMSPAARSPILGIASYLAEPGNQVALSRQQLFEDLSGLLPSWIKPATGSLTDLV